MAAITHPALASMLGRPDMLPAAATQQVISAPVMGSPFAGSNGAGNDLTNVPNFEGRISLGMLSIIVVGLGGWYVYTHPWQR